MLFKNKFTGNFEFPTITLYNGDSFRNAKQKLLLHLCKERFKLFYGPHVPIMSITRDFYEHELEDPKNRNFKGVRTFYYPGFHFRGNPCVIPSTVNSYVDYIFTPKMEVNRHVDKNYYNSIINCLQEK